ncbi:hypothetical protein [Kitasatospora sp. GAS1066B]|uniref:hypothetical protein n=1 Tax=Kitasatospora sp. GAS1066B TaxID=3156271 RepID=UPI003516012A
MSWPDSGLPQEPPPGAGQVWGPPPPPPPWPPAPHVPPVPPAGRPTRRRKRRLLLAGTLALALLVALAAWLSSAQPTRPTAQPVPRTALDQAPFAAALAALAGAPEVRYQDSEPGVGAVDARVTANGEVVGTITSDGASYGLLRVDGKVYVKPPDSGLPNATNAAQTAALKGRWMTGRDIDDLLGTVPARLLSPAELSLRLDNALLAGRSVPPANDPGTVLDGIPVLSANTSLGVLSVTRDAPYRIVRLAPTAGGAASPLALGPPPAGSVAVAAYHPGGAAALGSAASLASAPDLPGTNFPAEQPGDAQNTYQGLVNDTKSLADAVDSDLQFNLQGNGQLSCSDAGCQVTVSVSNTISATGAGSTVVGGNIAAELTATITVEGRPAPGCTGQGSLPLNGTGTMSCSAGGAGAVVASVEAQKKAAAEAQSRAEGGVSVPYYVNYAGEYYVYATAQVDVAKLVQDENQEAADQQRPCPTAAPGTSASSFTFDGRTGIRVTPVSARGTGTVTAAADSTAPIPQVDNPDLQNIIKALYHGVDQPGSKQIGDGSAFAAASHEANGGPLVNGKQHALNSVPQLRSALARWLTTDSVKKPGQKRVPVVKSARDVKVANTLLKAADDALAGKYNGYQNYPGLGDC